MCFDSFIETLTIFPIMVGLVVAVFLYAASIKIGIVYSLLLSLMCFSGAAAAVLLLLLC